MLRSAQVTIDTAYPDRLADFWVAALGNRDRTAMESFIILDSPQASGPRLNLQRVAEPKPGKNRVHLDVDVGGA